MNCSELRFSSFSTMSLSIQMSSSGGGGGSGMLLPSSLVGGLGPGPGGGGPDNNSLIDSNQLSNGMNPMVRKLINKIPLELELSTYRVTHSFSDVRRDFIVFSLLP